MQAPRPPGTRTRIQHSRSRCTRRYPEKSPDPGECLDEHLPPHPDPKESGESTYRERIRIEPGRSTQSPQHSWKGSYCPSVFAKEPRKEKGTKKVPESQPLRQQG